MGVLLATLLPPQRYLRPRVCALSIAVERKRRAGNYQRRCGGQCTAYGKRRHCAGRVGCAFRVRLVASTASCAWTWRDAAAQSTKRERLQWRQCRGRLAGSGHYTKHQATCYARSHPPNVPRWAREAPPLSGAAPSGPQLQTSGPTAMPCSRNADQYIANNNQHLAAKATALWLRAVTYRAHPHHAQ